MSSTYCTWLVSQWVSTFRKKCNHCEETREYWPSSSRFRFACNDINSFMKFEWAGTNEPYFVHATTAKCNWGSRWNSLLYQTAECKGTDTKLNLFLILVSVVCGRKKRETDQFAPFVNWSHWVIRALYRHDFKYTEVVRNLSFDSKSKCPHTPFPTSDTLEKLQLFFS